MIEKQYEMKGTIADFLTEYRPGEAVYLATPYSGHPRGIHAAHTLARVRSSEIMGCGVSLFCPIMHSHLVAELYGLPKDQAFWMAMDLPWLRKADWLVVDPLGTDWRDSKGVSTEVEEARKRGIRIFWLED